MDMFLLSAIHFSGMRKLLILGTQYHMPKQQIWQKKRAFQESL